VNLEKMTPEGDISMAGVSAMTQLTGWQEGHPTCSNPLPLTTKFLFCIK